MNQLRYPCKGEVLRWRRCFVEFSGDGYGEGRRYL